MLAPAFPDVARRMYQRAWPLTEQHLMKEQLFADFFLRLASLILSSIDTQSGFVRIARLAMSTSRRIIGRYPLPELPGWELRTLELTIKPGSSPAHTHPRLGINYVVQGELHSQFEGGEIVKVNAGDGFEDLPDLKHTMIHNPGTIDTVIVVSYVIKIDEANVVMLDHGQ